MLLAKLWPGLHVAYQPHPSRKPKRVVVLDTQFLPDGKEGQVLVAPVDDDGAPLPGVSSFNVGVRTLTGTWEESLVTQARIAALGDSAAKRIQSFTEIAAEIVSLVGAPDGEIRLGMNPITQDIVIEPAELLKLVKRARRTALDEFSGIGGRFGPAPV
jgi:hypothetical protein